MSNEKEIWSKITLGEFVSLQRGHDLTNDERKEGTVPVFGAAGENGYHNKAIAKAPGIVVGRSGGSFGQVHLSKEDFWPHNTALYVTDFKGNDPYFAYYLLKQLNFNSLNSGSAQPSLNRNFLYPVSIKVPQAETQQKIASVLSSLDAKIELNNRINAELEAMAKTIYDYWFVQFDFPDANGKPYKSSGGKMVWNKELKREVPEGWEVKDLGSEITIHRGLSYTSKELDNNGIPMINLNSFNLDGTYKTEGIKYYSGNYLQKHTVKAGELLIAATDVTRNAEIIGKAILVPNFYDHDVVFSMDIAKVVSPNIHSSFLMMLFNSDHYHNYIKWYANGTLVLHLNLDGINRYKTELPPFHLIELFNQVYLPMATRIFGTAKENKQLTELRDWLLPMLMNGQVKVN